MLKLKDKQQLATKTIAELETLAHDLEKEIMHISMSVMSKQAKNVKEGKKLKHKLAVVKTFITQKKIN